ncbi:MAG TPA: PAS domain S-box protein, partial [Gemmata sp.]
MHPRPQNDYTNGPGWVGRDVVTSGVSAAGADNRYRAVVESAFDAVVVIDRHSLIVGWNRSAERIFGYTSEEVCGRDVAVIIPVRYAAMHEEAVRAFNPERQSSRMHGRVVELTATRKGGKEFPIELTLAHWQEEGDSYFAGIVRDTTDRKRAEEAIRESEERFRQLAGAIGDVFWLADTATGDVLYVSSAFEQIWARPPEPQGEHLSNWLNVIHPEDRRTAAAAFEGARRGEPFDVQCRLTRPDGSTRWVRLTGGPSRDAQGQVRRIAGLVTDTTEHRRLAERLRNGQKMEAVGRLAGGVAHDFN